jgi:hypothetical protein
VEFGKLNNEKLIERFEEIMAEQLNLLREFYSRFGRGEISSSEFERYKEISENTAIALMDLLPSQTDVKFVENTIRGAVSDVVKKAFDENR